MFIILEGAKDAFEVFFDKILLIWIDKESVCNFRENKNYILVLLAHMALCHHFASVIRICKLFIFFSETTEPIWTKFGRDVHWGVLYQNCYFGADRKSNMAARANNVFWLVEILKIFLSETTQPMEL
jgi:hypothetical protein